MSTKTKVILSVIGAAIYGTIVELLTPASALVNNNLTLATVNGGDAEFILSKSVPYLTDSGFIGLFLIFIVMIGWIWIPSKTKKTENVENKS